MTIRIPISALLALLLSLAAWTVLWQAINKPVTVDVRAAVPVVFTPQFRDTPLELKPRERPQPPQAPPRLTLPALTQTAVVPEGVPGLLRVPAGGTPGTGIGKLGEIGAASSPMPLVRPAPVYPAPALRRGIEGWVKVEFGISGAGTVLNPRVVDAQPRGVFEKAALQAIERWRYQPRSEGGVPVEYAGVQAVIRFDLED